jgi:hypothetical protein
MKWIKKFESFSILENLNLSEIKKDITDMFNDEYWLEDCGCDKPEISLNGKVVTIKVSGVKDQESLKDNLERLESYCDHQGQNTIKDNNGVITVTFI